MLSRTQSRAAAVALATFLPVATWVIAVPLSGVALDVPLREAAGTHPIGLPAVLVTALAAALAGWTLLVVLERVTRWAAPIWTVSALAVLAVSFVPLLDAAMPAGTAITFAIMRLVLAGVLIAGLIGPGQRGRPEHTQPLPTAVTSTSARPTWRASAGS